MNEFVPNAFASKKWVPINPAMKRTVARVSVVCVLVTQILKVHELTLRDEASSLSI
jgi:hypothetical protein